MIGPLMFSIPDEVLFELMDRERDYEYEAQFDHEPSQAIRSHAMNCPECGHSNLVLRSTRHGERLVYATGPLKGKIHACQSE